jgi:hypothetical protein
VIVNKTPSFSDPFIPLRSQWPWLSDSSSPPLYYTSSLSSQSSTSSFPISLALSSSPILTSKASTRKTPIPIPKAIPMPIFSTLGLSDPLLSPTLIPNQPRPLHRIRFRIRLPLRLQAPVRRRASSTGTRTSSRGYRFSSKRPPRPR